MTAPAWFWIGAGVGVVWVAGAWLLAFGVGRSIRIADRAARAARYRDDALYLFDDDEAWALLDQEEGRA